MELNEEIQSFEEVRNRFKLFVTQAEKDYKYSELCSAWLCLFNVVLSLSYIPKSFFKFQKLALDYNKKELLVARGKEEE